MKTWIRVFGFAAIIAGTACSGDHACGPDGGSCLMSTSGGTSGATTASTGTTGGTTGAATTATTTSSGSGTTTAGSGSATTSSSGSTTGCGGCCGAGLIDGTTLTVDGAAGSDLPACCGVAGNAPCQTLTKAMALIDAAEAKNVTIHATVDGGGGDWSPAGEQYPVVLGWGVELSAPGVYFADPLGSGSSEILDVNFASSNDTVGYASIVGTPTDPIGVGMNVANTFQTTAISTVAVEHGATLYLANASINSSYLNVNHASHNITSILLEVGATLWLGQDQSAAVTGTVQIGNALGTDQTDGAYGIYCNYDLAEGIGCTVRDAALVGQSSVVIEGQRDGDIWAADFADISLSSAPIIGTPPDATNQCRRFEGTQTAFGISLGGQARMSFANGTVQCVWGDAFELSPDSFGAPTLAIDNALITWSTGAGIMTGGGTATVTNSMIRQNVIGVEQAGGTIDLSGGGNAVICNHNLGNPYEGLGIGVYNRSGSTLNASNVAWDTPGPDYFKCDSMLQNCSCNLGACTLDAGADGMDAVQDSTVLGAITTTGHTLSDAGCS